MHMVGIWSPEQVAAWKKVTTEVKDNGKGGKFMCQLWHMGRQGHSDIMGVTPPSASATKMSGDVTVKHHKKKPYETAHAMTVEEIQSTIEDYKKAAEVCTKNNTLCPSVLQTMYISYESHTIHTL